jgi:hypothetical protein
MQEQLKTNVTQCHSVLPSHSNLYCPFCSTSAIKVWINTGLSMGEILFLLWLTFFNFGCCNWLLMNDLLTPNVFSKICMILTKERTAIKLTFSNVKIKRCRNNSKQM